MRCEPQTMISASHRTYKPCCFGPGRMAARGEPGTRGYPKHHVPGQGEATQVP